jgi:hypothetical protein
MHACRCAGPPRAAQRARTGKLLLQAALAGGIASSSTTLMMFPVRPYFSSCNSLHADGSTW